MTQPRAHCRRPPATNRRRAFSLAECAISLLLVSVVIVGAMNAVSITQRTRLTVQSERAGLELAQSLLTEIAQACYQEPTTNPGFGPEMGEWTGTRSLYDDVDDYNFFWEMSPKDKDGTTISGYSGWSRNAFVAWVNPIDPTGAPSFSETGLKRITVSVTDPKFQATTLVMLRASKGVGEQAPVATTTFVTSARVDIVAGSSSAQLSSGVNLINGAK